MNYEQVLRSNGICSDCGTVFVHHIDEPFASCSCGTSEWTELDTPYMKLQLQLYKVENLNKVTE